MKIVRILGRTNVSPRAVFKEVPAAAAMKLTSFMEKLKGNTP